jgi:hypothetical protein
MKPLRLAAISLLLAASACAPDAGTPFPLPDGGTALRWGGGPYGVVLVPDEGRDAASWERAARVLAEEGMTVVALESGDATGLVDAIGALQEGGVERVAVLAAGSASEGALQLGEEEPERIDQLIVLSPEGDVSRLGVFPKLFVATRAETGEVERMAREAPGDWNAVYFVPGDARGQEILDGEGGAEALDAIVQRLEERR